MFSRSLIWKIAIGMLTMAGGFGSSEISAAPNDGAINSEQSQKIETATDGFSFPFKIMLLIGEGFGWDEHEAVANAENEAYAKVEAILESEEHVCMITEGIIVLEPAFRAEYGVVLLIW